MSENNEPKKDAVMPNFIQIHSGSTPSEEDNDEENGYDGQIHSGSTPSEEDNDEENGYDGQQPTEIDEDKDIVEKAKNKLTKDEYDALMKQKDSDDELRQQIQALKEAIENKDKRIKNLQKQIDGSSQKPAADVEPDGDKPAGDKEQKVKENMANILVDQIGEDPSKLSQAIRMYRGEPTIMTTLSGVLVKQIGQDPFKLSQAIRTYRGDPAIMNILGNMATEHMNSLSKVPVITDDVEPPAPPSDEGQTPPADEGQTPPADDNKATAEEHMENMANERYPDPNNPNRDRFKDGMKFVIDRLPFPVRIPVLMIMRSALKNHPEDFNKLAGKESPREARMAGANLAVKSATALKNGCKSIYQSTKSIMKFFAPDVSRQTVAKDEKKKNILLRGIGKMTMGAVACLGAAATLVHFHVPVDHMAQIAVMKGSNFASHPIDNTMYALAKTLSMATHPILTAKQIMSGDFIHSFTQNLVTSAPAPSNVSAVANEVANHANHVTHGVNHVANHVSNGANHEHLNHGMISQGSDDDKLIDNINHHMGTGHEETITHLANNHNISNEDAKRFVDMMQKDEIPHHTLGETQEQRSIIAHEIDKFANEHNLSSMQMLHLQNLQEKIQLGNHLPPPPISPKM